MKTVQFQSFQNQIDRNGRAPLSKYQEFAKKKKFPGERINVDHHWMKFKIKKRMSYVELLLEFENSPEITYTRVRIEPCPVEIYTDVTNKMYE